MLLFIFQEKNICWEKTNGKIDKSRFVGEIIFTISQWFLLKNNSAPNKRLENKNTKYRICKRKINDN